MRPLTPMALRKEFPKSIPQYDPLIDEEFLLRTKRRLSDRPVAEQEKIMKRKTKEAEKEAMRELKKDTMVLQKHKQQERQFRKGASKTYKAGQNLKDEI